MPVRHSLGDGGTSTRYDTRSGVRTRRLGVKPLHPGANSPRGVVENLASCIDGLKKKGVRFRNELESGPPGKQIQLEDPDGNPIELFEPAKRE